MNYSELFQLAQEKGYDKSIVTYSEGVTSITYEYENRDIDALLSLTLIQKWLRDEHKIEVITLSDDSEDKEQFQFSVYYLWQVHTLAFGSKFNNYESALFEGIYKALKII